MKKNKRSICILFVFLVLIIIAPIIISISFSNVDKQSMMLSYIGSILASVIGTCGVFYTITYSQKNYREDIRLRMLPFLSFTKLRVNYFGGLEKILKDNEEKVIDDNNVFSIERYEKYVCTIKGNEIIYKTDFDCHQKELIEHRFMNVKKTDACSCNLSSTNSIFLPLEIKNVGLGPALTVSLGLNRTDVDRNSWTYMNGININAGDGVNFYIISENCGEKSDKLGDYVLSVHYNDIYSNKYNENFEIKIIYDKEKNKPQIIMKTAHHQNYSQ